MRTSHSLLKLSRMQTHTHLITSDLKSGNKIYWSLEDYAHGDFMVFHFHILYTFMVCLGGTVYLMIYVILAKCSIPHYHVLHYRDHHYHVLFFSNVGINLRIYDSTLCLVLVGRYSFFYPRTWTAIIGLVVLAIRKTDETDNVADSLDNSLLPNHSGT